MKTKTDLQIIQSIEKELGRKLEQKLIAEISFFSNSGYALNAKKEVIGLNLYNFKLKKIPSAVFQLSNLTTLNLGGNQLSSLPPQIAQLRNLTVLYLQNNRLSSLPPQIAQLRNLTQLSLRNNQLSSLPPQIGQLSNLKYLGLGENQLSTLPPQIAQLHNLRESDFYNNHFNLPEEIYRKRPQEIIQYILDLKEQGSYPLHEGKVILLGDGAAGKTALVERLVKGTFEGNTKMTEGVKIGTWQLDKVRLNMWDFGGQEIMRAMHQFFMTPRSLYLLVCTFRTDGSDTPIEDWLRLIKNYGDDSPVILVISKVDIHDLSIDEHYFTENYPIQAIVRTSAKTGEGIDTLREEIEKAICCKALKHIQDSIPTNWHEVKTHIRELQETKNYISLAHFRQICADHNISNTERQNSLLGLLKDLGIAFNYGTTGALHETNVLKPEWVTNGIYKIINNNELFHSKGRVSITDLERILPRTDYKGQEKTIIGMMQQFDLCFPLKNKRNTYLVPDLLPKAQPIKELKEVYKDSLQLHYQYESLPRSIMPQFITKINQLAENYWLHGVIVKKNANRALIQVNYAQNRLSIFIKGKVETRRSLLQDIRAYLDLLNKPLDHKPDVMLPIPSHPTQRVDLELLLQAEAAGDEEIRIKNVGKVSVKNLLDGVLSEEERQFRIQQNVSRRMKVEDDRNKRKQIARLQAELKPLDEQYEEMERKAERFAHWGRRFYLIVIISVAIILCSFFAFFIPPTIAFICCIGMMLLFGLTNSYFSYEQIKARKFQKLCAKEGFDLEEYKRKKEALKNLETSVF